MSIGVIIYLEGLSVRHPKGARSIGIGHPRSGDEVAGDALLFRKRQKETPRDSERQLLLVWVLYLHCWSEPQGALAF